MSNRLASSHSPYLLQHAANPVHWYEWSEEAFEKARAEDKPVFLSIGYSTCHWCHVMAHESFEDQEVADLLNESFISVKVDREERPDVDRIYMEVCQALTGQGGWPLTVVMDYERRPFFAGTYFPKAPAGERHGMLSLLPLLAKTWKNQRSEVLDSAESILVQLASFQSGLAPSSLNADLFKKAQAQFKARFDSNHGGFGTRPKFPTPYNLNFLLSSSHLPGHSDSSDMALATLRKMRAGGIYDQLGFGFHRYSTDREWLLPHFEKMLYDQALHVLAYTEAWECTHEPIFKETVGEILTYVARDLKDSLGGFYSAEDADSEGEEGKFYFWTEAEIRNLLPPEEADLFISWYSILPEGNFAEEHSGIKTSANILHHQNDPESALQELSLRFKHDAETLKQKLESMRTKLFEVRSKRIRPFLDDKILTDWNGLMIAAFSKAGRIFADDNFKKAADTAVSFLFGNLVQNGRLVKRSRLGVAGLTAHLDDYAFVIFGLLENYEAGFDEATLEKALLLVDFAVSLFWDEEKGAFYFTSGETDELPIRSIEFYDGAIPSGNAVMAWNLVKLSRLFYNDEWEKMARRIGEAAASTLNPYPINHGFYLRALLQLEAPFQEVTLIGKKALLPDFLEVLRNNHHPNRLILFKDIESLSESKVFSVSSRSAMTAPDSGMNAYVCAGKVCQAPVSSVKELEAVLNRV